MPTLTVNGTELYEMRGDGPPRWLRGAVPDRGADRCDPRLPFCAIRSLRGGDLAGRVPMMTVESSFSSSEMVSKRVLGALPLWKVQESSGRSGASGWRSSATPSGPGAALSLRLYRLAAEILECGRGRRVTAARGGCQDCPVQSRCWTWE